MGDEGMCVCVVCLGGGKKLSEKLQAECGRRRGFLVQRREPEVDFGGAIAAYYFFCGLQ